MEMSHGRSRNQSADQDRQKRLQRRSRPGRAFGVFENLRREIDRVSFQRALYVPEGVDADKIEAAFNKGVLTVTLPKTAEAQKAEKKIEVKAA